MVKENEIKEHFRSHILLQLTGPEHSTDLCNATVTQIIYLSVWVQNRVTCWCNKLCSMFTAIPVPLRVSFWLCCMKRIFVPRRYAQSGRLSCYGLLSRLPSPPATLPWLSQYTCTQDSDRVHHDKGGGGRSLTINSVPLRDPIYFIYLLNYCQRCLVWTNNIYTFITYIY